MYEVDVRPAAVGEEVKLYETSGNLRAQPPFDFRKTLAFLNFFTPMRQEQTIDSTRLVKALMVQGEPVLFDIREAAMTTAENPHLAYTLYSAHPLSAEEVKITEDRMRFFLSLEEDLQTFYETAKSDPAFFPVVERLYGLHQVKFLTPFEIACWAVLCQRIPMTQARKLKDKLVARYGKSLVVGGFKYSAFPEVAQLKNVSLKELEEITSNERKAAYLQAVIEAFAEVDEQFLRAGDYDKVEAWLKGIKGIGEWSSAFILIRGLGRMERVPAEEKLQEAGGRVYKGGGKLSPAEIAKYAAPYGKEQGYWAYYLRISSF